MKRQTERGLHQVLQALGIPTKLKICLSEIFHRSGIQSFFQNNISRVFKTTTIKKYNNFTCLLFFAYKAHSGNTY